MDIGGRQGSRLTGRMFSKTMDVLAEEFIEEKIGVKLSPDLTTLCAAVMLKAFKKKFYH